MHCCVQSSDYLHLRHTICHESPCGPGGFKTILGLWVLPNMSFHQVGVSAGLATPLTESKVLARDFVKTRMPLNILQE